MFETIIRNKSHYQKRAYQCIKCLVTLFSSCPVAGNMLKTNGDFMHKWEVAVSWLHEELERRPFTSGNQYNYEWSPPAPSNDSSNSYYLERSPSARLTLKAAAELLPEERSEQSVEQFQQQQQSESVETWNQQEQEQDSSELFEQTNKTQTYTKAGFRKQAFHELPEYIEQSKLSDEVRHLYEQSGLVFSKTSLSERQARERKEKMPRRPALSVVLPQTMDVDDDQLPSLEDTNKHE